MLAIVFPQIDPVVLAIGPLEIRWYALAYIIGIVAGYFLLKKLNEKKPVVFSPEALDDLILYAVLGVVLGGRIGYVFFYDWEQVIADPLRALRIWQGGMSFHGGALGVILAIYILCRKHKISFLKALDLAAVVTPIGLFLGRVANFINGELYGRITDVSWGVVFPSGGPSPRHPSQLYEAGLEGILLFIFLIVFANIDRFRNKSGFLGGLFVAGYGIARIIVENYRQPDAHIGFIYEYITMGQLLSIPMVLIGGYFMVRPKKL